MLSEAILLIFGWNMSKDYEILFRLQAKYSSQFATGFSDAAEKIQNLSEKTAELNKTSKDISGLIAARERAKAAAAEYFRCKAAVEGLSKAVAGTKSPSTEMLKALSSQQEKLRKAKRALDAQKDSVRKGNAALSQYGKTTKDLIQSQTQMEQAVVRLTTARRRLLSIETKNLKAEQKMQASGDLAVSSIVMMQYVGEKAVHAMSAPVKAAMSMQDAMADIAKVVNFDDPEGIAKMQTTLEKMSLSIPVTAEGLAQIAAAAGQSGVAAGELAAFTEQAAKMGVAFDMTAADAGEMMAKWRSGMQLTQDQAVALADATNALSNANAAQAKQIGETLQRYGALGKVAGLTETQTAALAATVISSGAEAEVAATGINAFMRALTRGGSMTDLQAAAFGNIGFDPIQLQKQIQQDAPKAIMDVLNRIKVKVPKELQMQYLTAMFGDEGARALGPMLTNTELLAKNFELVAKRENYTGSMLGEFEARMKTTSNALELAGHAISYVSGAVGAPLLDPLRAAMLQFVRMGEAVGDWISQNQTFVSRVMTAGGAVMTAVMAFHAMRMAAGLALAPFYAVSKTVLTVRAAMLAGGAAAKVWAVACTGASLVAKGLTLATKGLGVALRFLCLNPVGLAVTAIAGLVAAGVALYKNWDTVKTYMSQTWAAIAAAAKSPINSMIGMINSLIDAINGLLSFKVPDWVPGVGGKSMSVEIPKVPQLAEGGVATGPTLAMVGEGREPEAILPLSRLPEVGGGRGPMSVSVNFAPVINLTGGKDAYEGVRRGLAEGSKSLKHELERLLADERRLSFS